MQKLLADNSLPVTTYRNLNRLGMSNQSVVLLLLRLSWGFELAQSGFSHLSTPEAIAAMTKRFTEWGVPVPHANVYISGITELTGGALLLLGLGTRAIALPLVINFIVAIVAASRGDIIDAFQKGFLTGWTKIVDDTAFPFLILALIMLAFGAGSISIDYLIGRKMFCKHEDTQRGFEVGRS